MKSLRSPSEEEIYIRELISEGEHGQQDFKFEITDSKKIAKTLVAFANTSGGRILIGVKDNGKIAGIRSDEEFYMIEAAATMYSKPEIRFESFRRHVSGKTVLEIIIQPSVLKPHFARDESGKWMAYHRVDDQNLLANKILLQVWKREKREKGTFIEYTDREQLILNYLEEKGLSSLSDFCENLPLNKRLISNVLVNLVSLGVIEMIFTEKGPFYKLSNEPE